MSLATPEKIRTLQRKLYRKAKAEPAYRFYLLYDKIYREDILRHAYALARSNAGAPGTDGMTFAAIEASGLERWLAGLREELISKTYRPDPVRRVSIPKPDGGERPLGIPTIRDRVVQTAAKLVLEPIFEADFEDNAYGYRPVRGAVDAVKEVYRLICRGYTDVVDADLSHYFDSIPHAELMKSVARRIVDRHVLRLIKLWLKAPIEERDDDGARRIGGGNGGRRVGSCSRTKFVREISCARSAAETTSQFNLRDKAQPRIRGGSGAGRRAYLGFPQTQRLQPALHRA
jgi:RNA-directed DNA polymerase